MAGGGLATIRAVLAAPGVNGNNVASIGADSREGVAALMRSLTSDTDRAARDPFYVLDLGVVVQLYNQWRRLLPTVHPFYAVKCNPDPALLGAMAALGAGFDCASRAEIEAVLALGVPPDRIVYANPCKAEPHLKFAAVAGVNLTTFDAAGEVDKLRRWHKGCSLLLRLKPQDDSEARCPLGPKYGALANEVVPLLRAARDSGLTVAGVAFHVGSGAKRLDAFGGAIAAVRVAFDAAERLGMPRMRVLDIGGGFTADARFAEATEIIRSALVEHFGDEHGLKIIAEPGRFFAESAFTLATNIIGKRVRGELREYWINDGVYGSMNCILNDHATVTAAPLERGDEEEHEGRKRYASTVFGPTCDALDTVVAGQALPEMEVDEWLVFPNMGAYTAAAGSNFNGFAISDIRTYLAYSTPPP